MFAWNAARMPARWRQAGAPARHLRRRGAVPRRGHHLTNPTSPNRRRSRPSSCSAAGGSGLFALLFWGGYVLLGSICAAVAAAGRRRRRSARCWRRAAGRASAPSRWLFVFIVGGQAFPLDIFPATGAQQLRRRRGRALPADAAGMAARLGGVGVASCSPLVGAASALDMMPRDGRGRDTDARVADARARTSRPWRDPCTAASSPARTSRRQDDRHARRSRGAARRGHGRAAVQEGAGLHRPDVARARRRPPLPQPRPYLMDGRRDPQQFASARADADIALVEGNKGPARRPGARRQQQQRGARRAKLGLPVLLVIDARGMTRGIAPLILGYQGLRPAHPHRRRDPQPRRRAAPRGQAARRDRALHRRAGARRAVHEDRRMAMPSATSASMTCRSRAG